MANKTSRTRNWTIVLYPDSAPDNWREILDELHIEWIESPLHDKDLNADGSLKKPHWHVLLMFGGVKAYEQVIELIKPLNSPIPQKCHNAKALVRYMAHLDNPEKVKYSLNDIKAHGGVDVSELLLPSRSERYTYIGEMMDWCVEEDITEFEDLAMYARREKSDSWFPLLCDNSSYIMSNFLKSRRHNPARLARTFVDPVTGEVIEDMQQDKD